MELHFTPEQESQLTKLALHEGRVDAGELLKAAAMRLLDEDARCNAAVLEAKAYADRGEFIEEEEMNTRFEHMLST